MWHLFICHVFYSFLFTHNLAVCSLIISLKQLEMCVSCWLHTLYLPASGSSLWNPVYVCRNMKRNCRKCIDSKNNLKNNSEKSTVQQPLTTQTNPPQARTDKKDEEGLNLKSRYNLLTCSIKKKIFNSCKFMQIVLLIHVFFLSCLIRFCIDLKRRFRFLTDSWKLRPLTSTWPRLFLQNPPRGQRAPRSAADTTTVSALTWWNKG